jgi:hypothetical protein
MTARVRFIFSVVALSIISSLVATGTAHAQRGGRRGRVLQPSARLEAITGLTCTFPAAAGGTWVGAEAQASVLKPEVFTLRFLQVEVGEGTANALGLGSPVEVNVRLVGGNLHFLDIRSNGALAVTTVFDTESRPGHLKAVHSRSEFAPTTPFGEAGPPDVSQFYGDCEPGTKP